MNRLILTLSCLMVAITMYPQDITQGVVLHYLMNDEDEMIDQSPSALDGVIGSAAYTEDRFGVEDEALMFDGSFDFAVISDSDALEDVTTIDDAQFAISLWHRTGDALPDLSPLICKYAHSLCGETERQWALLIAEQEGVRFYFASTPDNGNYRSISTIPAVAQEPNTWYHIVVNYDGSVDTNDGLDRVEIWVDNMIQPDTVNFSIGEFPETIGTGNAPIGFMSYVSPDDDNCGEFNAPGALDDLLVYDRTLSPAEIDLLYNEGVSTVEEINPVEQAISISPSLVDNGQLTVNINKELGPIQVSVLDLNGRAIIIENIASLIGPTTLSVNELESGSYLLQVLDQEGRVAVKRFVVQ